MLLRYCDSSATVEDSSATVEGSSATVEDSSATVNGAKNILNGLLEGESGIIDKLGDHRQPKKASLSSTALLVTEWDRSVTKRRVTKSSEVVAKYL